MNGKTRRYKRMLEAFKPVTDFRPFPPPFMGGSARSPPSLGSDNLFYRRERLGKNPERHGDRRYTYAYRSFSK